MRRTCNIYLFFLQDSLFSPAIFPFFVFFLAGSSETVISKSTSINPNAQSVPIQHHNSFSYIHKLTFLLLFMYIIYIFTDPYVHNYSMNAFGGFWGRLQERNLERRQRATFNLGNFSKKKKKNLQQKLRVKFKKKKNRKSERCKRKKRKRKERKLITRNSNSNFREKFKI